MANLKHVILCMTLVLLTACGGKKTHVGLEVDLYMHPEASSPNDLLLQSAIRKQLKETEHTQQSLIHVRVSDSIVFLSGTVKTQEIKDAATAVATDTVVSVSNQPGSRATQVINRLEIAR